ncbi:hypothetical protein HQ447_18105 [bacterium]|nr:hypothetical protein [bacterium]
MIPSYLTPIARTVFLVSWMSCVIATGHGTHDERVELYSAKLLREPENVIARHELALAYVENGDWQMALAQLDAADRMKKPDSDLDFSITRARALAVGGQLAEARAVLDAFLQKSPADALALLERARIFGSLKMPAECLADYRRAMAGLANPDPDVFLEMADQLDARQLHDEAIALIQKGLETQGQVPSLVLKALDLELAAARYDDALKRVDSMAKLMPRAEPWLAKRAAVLARAGRIEESAREWQALLQRIDALPNLDRGSVAMSAISREAQQALATLSTHAVNSTTTPR